MKNIFFGFIIAICIIITALGVLFSLGAGNYKNAMLIMTSICLLFLGQSLRKSNKK